MQHVAVRYSKTILLIILVELLIAYRYDLTTNQPAPRKVGQMEKATDSIDSST